MFSKAFRLAARAVPAPLVKTMGERLAVLRGEAQARNAVQSLLTSGVFDGEFYGAQLGLTFSSEDEAARHFVTSGAAGRWSPHPLIMPDAFPANTLADWSARGTEAMLSTLWSEDGLRREWGPLFDPRRVCRSAGTVDGQRRLLLDWLGELTPSTPVPVSSLLGEVTVPWGVLRQNLIAAARSIAAQGLDGAAESACTEVQVEDDQPHFGGSPHQKWVERGREILDWDVIRSGISARVSGRVSVSMPVFQDYRMTIAAVRSLGMYSDGHDVEVIVVDNGSDPGTSLALAGALSVYPHARVARLPLNYNFALGSNYGFSVSTGEFVLFLNNDTEVRAGWLEPLLAEIAKPEVRGVQPLLLYPDGTIQAAGTEFVAADAMPIHPLQGHPAEDGRAAAGVRFDVVTAAALLMRASEVADLEGFDPIFVNGTEDIDLCLRAVERFGGWFAVAPDSVVEHKESKTPGRKLRVRENRRVFFERYAGRFPLPTHHLYDAAGFEVKEVGLEASAYPAAKPVIGRRTTADAQSPLRWGVLSPAPGGSVGERWGDTHFIEDLAREMERLGETVVTHRRDAHVGPALRFDDVALGIRGLSRLWPDRAKTNVLWVISHPEDVSPAELGAFDLVYAASEPWAKEMSERWGLDVRPLLQATDTEAFRPREEPGLPGVDAPVVFVGQTRGKRPRKIVMDAIAAGVDVDVWGDGWWRFIPAERIRGSYFPNSELPTLYQQARVVLADHHPDMAREGFIANRIFDAVASGARVISDRVDGLDRLFGGAVRVYRSLDHLAWMVSPEGLAAAFPDDEEMHAISQRVAAEHSFRARAATIVGDVHELRGRVPMARPHVVSRTLGGVEVLDRED